LAGTFNDIINEAPSKSAERARLDGGGWPLAEALVHSGLSSSKGQARKDIEGGGIYLNNVRQENWQRHVEVGDLLFQRYLLLRKGKRNYVVLTVQ
jgi:tyrosyl-tRNA synthetase